MIIQSYFSHNVIIFHDMCCVVTLALGSQLKQGLVRLWAKRKPRSEGKCERINPHTPKGTLTLGIGISMDFKKFRDQFQGLKPIGLKKIYIIRKLLKCRCLK